MRHPLTSLLPVFSLLIFIGDDCAKGQTLSTIGIPGYKLHRVGCFGETTPPSGVPDLLFSDTNGNSTTKVDYKNFGNYLRGVVARCGKAAASRNYNFFAVHSVGNCYSGKGVSTTYAKNGPSQNCLNALATACASNQDCVGRENSTFVYRLQSLTTTPTTKPTSKPSGASTTGGATTTSPTATPLSTLTCLSYLVAIKATVGGAVTQKPNIPTPGATSNPTMKAAMATVSTVATTATSSPTPSVKAVIEAKVKAIYKGYSCLVCLKTVNASTSAVYLTLKFTCPGQHLKKLVAGLGASNIIKAVCYPPPCKYGVFVSPPCPSPCGVSSCVTVSPSLQMPPICPSTPVPVPVPAPAPFPPSRCSPPCPTTCAPACTSVCCRSAIHSKKRTGPSAKKSTTKSVDNDYDVEDDDNVDSSKV